jgi:hypothetical protein
MHARIQCLSLILTRTAPLRATAESRSHETRLVVQQGVFSFYTTNETKEPDCVVISKSPPSLFARDPEKICYNYFIFLLSLETVTGDYGGGPGRPPCWRTLKESCKGLGSVSLKINNRHTHGGIEFSPSLPSGHHYKKQEVREVCWPSSLPVVRTLTVSWGVEVSLSPHTPSHFLTTKRSLSTVLPLPSLIAHASSSSSPKSFCSG